jgi:hypothetical protein
MVHNLGKTCGIKACDRRFLTVDNAGLQRGEKIVPREDGSGLTPRAFHALTYMSPSGTRIFWPFKSESWFGSVWKCSRGRCLKPELECRKARGCPWRSATNNISLPYYPFVEDSW